MARLVTVGALLVALVVMAQASTNPIVETEGGEANQFRRGRCREELRGRRLFSCQQYLQRGRGGYYLMLQRGFGGGRDQLEDCCRELRNMDPDCRCDAIEEALEEARDQRERYGGGRRYGYGGGRGYEERRGYYGGGRGYEERRGYYGGGEEREIERRAENLPNMCGFERPRRCDVRGY